MSDRFHVDKMSSAHVYLRLPKVDSAHFVISKHQTLQSQEFMLILPIVYYSSILC